MSRAKKTRKTGPIGVPKSAVKPKVSESRKKKRVGKKPGSRNSELLKKPSGSSAGVEKDKRLGSKKPIPLVQEIQKAKFKTPQEELEYIENDPVLQSLLDKQDQNQPLTPKEQHLVDEKLARHQFLCELLGIDEQDDEF